MILKRHRYYLVVLILAGAFSRLLATGFNDGLEKAIQQFQDGNLLEAKRLFLSCFEEDPRNAKAALYIGRIYMAQGELDESILWLSRAVQLDDQDSESHHWLGNAYGQKAQKAGLLKKAGWAKKMKKEVEKAVELDEDNIDARFSLLQYYQHAPGFMGGSKEQAKIQAQEIKERDVLRGYCAFGLIYEAEGQDDLAEAEYKACEKAMANSVAFYEFFNTYGYFLLRQNRVDEAIQKFKKQVELAPDNANAYDSLGDGYRAAERWEDAMREYRKALEIDPDFAAAMKHLEEVEKKITSNDESR
jgi:tetratricopeptide (TPR) repeat protein